MQKRLQPELGVQEKNGVVILRGLHQQHLGHWYRDGGMAVGAGESSGRSH